MDEGIRALRDVWPALAFLLAAVPFAHLLGRLGLFGAVATAIERRTGSLPVRSLWILAAGSTALLNLDTAIVLLTPLAVELAARADEDPVPIAVIPLLLAASASSVLPVSNLTTLIVVERADLSIGDVLLHGGLPSLAAVVAGWVVYRRRHPSSPVLRGASPAIDGRALRVGLPVVAAVVVGFVLGPAVGVDPWAVLVAADVVLVAVVGSVPLRQVPALTAAVVAVVAMSIGAVVPASWTPARWQADGAGGALLGVAAGTVVANAVNNIPAAVVAAPGGGTEGHGADDAAAWSAAAERPAADRAALWGWLVGINVGSALLPTGSLANVLWLRLLRQRGIRVGLDRWCRVVVPLAVAPLLAASIATAVLGV